MSQEGENVTKNPMYSYPTKLPPSVSGGTTGSLPRRYSNASLKGGNATPRVGTGATRIQRSDSHQSLGSQQTTGTAASAVPKAFNQLSFGESNLLREIENEAEESVSGKYNVRKRAGTVATELTGHRTRKASLESVDGTGGKLFTYTGKSKLQRLFDFLDIVVPRLQQRLSFYAGMFFLLLLFIISGYFTHSGSSVGMFFCIMLIDTATAITDHAVFVYFIDPIFINHYKIAYLLHGFNGPLGLLLCVLIVGASLKGFKAAESLPNWDHLIVACVFVIICICMKNWFIRKHYTALLEKRFLTKLFKLETWNILLSELATSKPPKAPNAPDNSASVSQRKRNSNNNNIAAMLENMHVPDPSAMVDPLVQLQQKVINVFADLVDATSRYNDEYEEDVDMALLLRSQQGKSQHAGNNNDDIGEEADLLEKGGYRRVHEHEPTPTPVQASGSLKEKEKLALKSQIRKRKTFWELAARISSSYGTVRVYTYNGPVLVHRKFQAKQFGRSLYKHLSRGGKVSVTTDMLKAIFVQSAESHKDEFSGNWIGGSSKGGSSSRKYASNYNYQAVQMQSADLEKDTPTLLFESCLELFDPFRVGTISEEQCMAALCMVYKEARFAATSLNEYGELHASLRTVIDVVFWLIMLVVLQAFLQLNLFSYLLPFISLALTVSFALSQALGNLFLAIMFVFFMVPYDIGNKVYIGPENNRIVGFVKSVSLLYTTINTTKNEVMKIPNHTLFGEKICNLQESGGAVIEITMNFNLVDKDGTAQQDKIDAFVDSVKQHCIVENKMKWQSCFICASAINSVDNFITYMFWVTHRENWQDVGKIFNDRTELIKYIKGMQLELGLEFVKIKQCVELVREGDADGDDLYGGDADRRVRDSLGGSEDDLLVAPLVNMPPRPGMASPLDVSSMSISSSHNNMGGLGGEGKKNE